MSKNMQIVALAILTFMAVSCGKKETKHDNTPLVDVYVVGSSDSQGKLTFTGKTKSADEINLAFRVAGQIQTVFVNEGDHVSKGQVVAEMDSRDYKVQLAATQAEYDGIKAEAERVMALYEEGNTTKSNYDKARYGLQQITQKLNNHKNQLEDTKLRSNIDGFVGAKLHEGGETVGAGMPIVSIFGNNNVEVEIRLSATDFASLDNMTNFYCKFDITGDEHFPMTVTRKSQEANSSQLYGVRLRFANKENIKKITPGMSTIVYADVKLPDSLSTVNVPSTALLNKEGKASVFVYDEKSGTVHLQPVSVSTLHRDGTADITEGLKHGDVIVCTGVHHISDGEKVKRMEKKTESNVGGLL